MINQKTIKEAAALEGRTEWYLVNTKAGQERFALMQLRMQGFETYLPMRAPLKDGAVPKPLFPAYLFVRVDLARPGWRAIYSTLGVKSVISTGRGESAKPKAMLRGLVPGLMAMEREGLIPLTLTASNAKAAAKPSTKVDDRLAPGDRVVLPFGAAGGVIEAVLAERIDAHRGVVLISMLGRDSRATVDLASLTKPSAVAVQDCLSPK